MVRNIPVDVARNTCADIVIVVNLVEPPPTAEKLAQATQLLSRSMDVMFEVEREDPAELAHGARHPHRRADGRHLDGRLRPRAGHDSARRGGRAEGRGPPVRACRRGCGVHGVAAEGQHEPGVRDTGRRRANRRPRSRQSGLPQDHLDHSSRRQGRHQRDQRGCRPHVGAQGPRVGRVSAGRRSQRRHARLAAAGGVHRHERPAAQHGALCRRRRRPQVPAGRPARPQLAERPRRPVAQQSADRL